MGTRDDAAAAPPDTRYAAAPSLGTRRGRVGSALASLAAVALLVIAAGFFATPATRSLDPAPTPASEQLPVGEPKLALELSARRRTIGPGKPLGLSTKLRNVGDIPAAVVVANRPWAVGTDCQVDHDLQIRRSPSRGDVGVGFGWDGVRPSFSTRDIVVLAPGEAVSIDPGWENWARETRAPGTYQVRAVYLVEPWPDRGRSLESSQALMGGLKPTRVVSNPVAIVRSTASDAPTGTNSR